MAFLDSAASDAAEAPGPSPQGGGGTPPGSPPGGGPILAGIAQRQRGPQVSAPGMGDHGQSLTLVKQAHILLKQALPGLMQGSPIEQDVLKIMQRLSRHLPATDPSIGQQQTAAQDMIRNMKKNALLQMIMQQIRPQQGQGGAPPGGPPGAMAQAPMPSTPLPGA